MTNEAVLLVQKTFPENMTCANATGISKGTILKLADPNTASASTGTYDIVAGIAYTQKVASDGNTQIAVLTGPGDIVKLVASGSIAVGDPVGTAAPGNQVISIANVPALSGSKRLGYARETATDGETLKVVLNIGSGLS